MRIRVSMCVVASTIFVVNGCGLVPDKPVRDPDARPPSPSAHESASGSRRPTVPATTEAGTTAPSPSGFNPNVAVPCNGRPTGEQVIAALRRAGTFPAQSRPAVTSGPLCAGTWQYTVVAVPDREPVHVVTKGQPATLTVITAGTNPCTPKVRVEAPQGIRSALRCDA